jgi:hypothetical protein
VCIERDSVYQERDSLDLDLKVYVSGLDLESVYQARDRADLDLDSVYRKGQCVSGKGQLGSGPKRTSMYQGSTSTVCTRRETG